MDTTFRKDMAAGYTLDEPAIVLGSPLLGAEVLPEVRVQVALAMLNRHGLIAGATGTGKTKTLQLMAEQLSKAGVPVFVADIKGDLSGLAAPGETSERTTTRATEVGGDAWTPTDYPIEFYTLGGKGTGTPVRARITSFGPIL